MGFDPISAVADLLTTGIKAIFPDKTVETQAVYGLAQKIVDQVGQQEAAQAKTNEAEAATGSWFIAGWRPMIGWACSLGLWYTFILVPLTDFLFVATGHIAPELPTLNDNLWQLTLGMLGLGGMRTLEKLQGADTKAISGLVNSIGNI